MSNELEARIIELEVRAAYQDQTIAALDEVVRIFADRVDELFAEITRLRQSVEEKAIDIGQPDEPPPHY
jgi:uncharacterized coiled-coil protein SlyX